MLLRGGQAGLSSVQVPAQARGATGTEDPYGDDPADQIEIQKGIDYFRCKCFP
jgi:hypothetical protein